MSNSSNKQAVSLALYDTSNFQDFPLGGQLTSIRNFLRYVAECRSEDVSGIVLVGVTLDPKAVGSFSTLELFGLTFRFLPVALAESDQGHTKSSLRLKYAKGLVKYLPKVGLSKMSVNYIHTPEAYGPIKLIGRGKRIVFSHGSFFNMQKGFRFYKDSWISRLFERYLVWLIKGADRLFVIDDDSYGQYSKLNSNVSFVSNSIDYREDVKRDVDLGAVKLLFVGRLSAGKRIGPIIEAAEACPNVASLLIVGEGEEGDSLRKLAGQKTTFVGALDRNGVRKAMRESDILVMNSEFEGVPMTILEAMGMAMAIISTNVGGIPLAVRFGENAVETDGSPEAIEASIKTIVNNYGIMSSKSYEISEQFYYKVVNAFIYKKLTECGDK